MFKSFKVGCFVSTKIGNNITSSFKIGCFMSSEIESAPSSVFGALTLQLSNFHLLYSPNTIHQSRSLSVTSIRAAPARCTNLILSYDTLHVPLSPDNTHLCANLSWGGFYSNIQLLSNIHLHKNTVTFTIDLLYSYPIKQQHHHVQESAGAFHRRVTARQHLMGQQEATRSAVVLHLHLQR